MPAPPEAVDGAAAGWELEVTTSIEPGAGGRVKLVARLKNATPRPLSFVIRARCPGTAARFQGLTDGYDFGALCGAGACVGGPSTSEAPSLGVGAEIELGRVTIDPAGDDCNPALPDGRYTLSAAVEVEGAVACSVGTAAFTASGRAVPRRSRPQRPRRPSRPRPGPLRTPHPAPSAPPQREKCPAMACAYTPCPSGVEPPAGCAAVCGCTGMQQQPPAVRATPQ